MTGDGDATAHQVRTPLRPASDAAAASAFPIAVVAVFAPLIVVFVVFVLGQRHCIRVEWAIHVPALAKVNIFTINSLGTHYFQILSLRVQSIANESNRTATGGGA